MAQGDDVVLEIDFRGALQIKQLFPWCSSSSCRRVGEELAQRLIRRGDTQPEVIATRMANARIEIDQARHFDFVVINAVFDSAFST